MGPTTDEPSATSTIDAITEQLPTEDLPTTLTEDMSKSEIV